MPAAVRVLAACLLACSFLAAAAADKWQPQIPPEVCIRLWMGPYCVSRKPHSSNNFVNFYECSTPGLSHWAFRLVDSTPGADGAYYQIRDTRTGHCLYPHALGDNMKNGTEVSVAKCSTLSPVQKTWFVQWCKGHRRGWEIRHPTTGYWLSYSGLIRQKFYRPVMSFVKTYFRFKSSDGWIGLNTG